MAAAPSSAQAQLEEYRVKAAFIFHFTQLVDWPAAALANDALPFVLCASGDRNFSEILAETVRGKRIGAHSMEVRALSDSDSVADCHVLVAVGADRKRVLSTLARLKNAPVLTVGESDDFVRSGGMIGFALQENKVRFDVNLDAAQHASLKLSSRLLVLARNVVGDSRTR